MKQDLSKIARSGGRRSNQLMLLVALVAVVTVSVDAVPPVIRPEGSAATTTTTTMLMSASASATMGMVASHETDKPAVSTTAAFFVKSSVDDVNKIRGGNLDDLDIEGGGNTPPVYDEEDDEDQYDLEDEDLEEEHETMEEAEHILEDSDTEEVEEDEDVDDWEDLEELEEDIIAVEVSALQEENDLEEEEDLKDIVEDVLEDLEDENLEEDSPVMVGATTTDGELADDEETDSGGVASAEELVAVTAGGASSIDDDDDGTEEETATFPSNSTSVVTSVDIEEVSEISGEMKRILRNELSYTRREVQLMRPEIAAMVVYNRLSRPGEGMPPNFYIEGYGPPGPLLEHSSKIVVTAIAVGTVALTATSLNDGDFDLENIVDALKSIPKVLLAAGAAVSGKVGAALPSKKPEAAAVPSDTVGMVGLPGEMIEAEVVEETTRGSQSEDSTDEPTKDDLVHSIKPGTKSGPKVNEDETALDKFLTKVENLIKGFFRIKI